MLPRGFSAEAASASDRSALQSRLPGARTVGTLRLGGCACLLRVARTGEDERHLRRRYAALGLTRERTIAALERHRRGGAPAGAPEAWRAALAGFVAEHARNAGPTLYLLDFSEAGAPSPGDPRAASPLSADVVRHAPDTWLPEGALVEVTG